MCLIFKYAECEFYKAESAEFIGGSFIARFCLKRVVQTSRKIKRIIKHVAFILGVIIYKGDGGDLIKRSRSAILVILTNWPVRETH